ncbi:hypothetical protein [Paramaledivibacter caminithermalis]|jgi:hypothetical protein|uniref:Lipoprotein n=1 Tax=Paramaledivibacter caminithermalis (strain DSM 15212 / CIP 107654 / DViRD3) TaxID=1121301 RepID=A0A1M6MS76_PARC5|nr:hypothetical protein [Paramaledivibacter caminithermalis]SHJ86256.1 hypothetical protein SAMN02745912_01387 [Paramaledivibacter caminithermalis DSM 15212]
MRNKYKLFIVFLSISLLFSACSKVKTEVEKNTEKENIEVANKEGEKKFSRPDMFGRVKSIIGNEVVLELAEMPQREGKGQGSKDEGKNVGATKGINTDNKLGQKPQSGAVKREFKLTGETATILIPVGVPITTRSSGKIKNLDIVDIYEGSMLQIWTDKDKNINRVMMIQGRQAYE